MAKKTQSSEVPLLPIPEAVSHVLSCRNVAPERPTYAAIHDDNYRWLPDASVDLVLTDPPFNIAQDTNFHTFEKNTIHSYRFDQDKGWDTYSQDGFILLLNEWSREIARVLRKGGSFAIFCADAYVSHLIDALKAAGLHPRRTVTWRKPNAVPINRKSMMMSSCEYIITGVKGGKATFNADLLLHEIPELSQIERTLVADKVANVVESNVRQSVARITTQGDARITDVAQAVRAGIAAATEDAVKRVTAMYVTAEDGSTYMRACVPNLISHTSKGGNRLHPTEKPVQILQYLTALLSRPGDVVLDPFGGSGSTGEAAILMNRLPIVVEMDKGYATALANRLQSL